jgi:hypothetical protein
MKLKAAGGIGGMNGNDSVVDVIIYVPQALIT